MASRDRHHREEYRPNRDENAMAPAGLARMSEYFLPEDGIDRDVIETNIRRYLGVDALLRPGTYENPTTRQVQKGYLIKSYGCLTTAIIADIKADSVRWLEERESLKSSSKENIKLDYRASATYVSRQCYGLTMDPGIGVSQSYGNNYYTASSDLKSFSDSYYGAARPLSDGSPKYEGETSPSATSTPPTISNEREGAIYGADSRRVRPSEAVRLLGTREQPTTSTYGSQAQLLQTAAQSTVAESITRAGIITAGTIGTIVSIGVGSSHYTSRQAIAQNEAKFAWEREQARRQRCLDEGESVMARRGQALREREAIFEARERTLQVELRELEHKVQRREEGIRRREEGIRGREEELNKVEKKQIERDKELNKIQAEIIRSKNELKQISEESREREEEWKRQQQQCHCCHLDPQPNSGSSSQRGLISGNEPPKPDLSTAPPETAKCSTPPPTEQRCNQIDSSPSLVNEGFGTNQQSLSFATSMAGQPSTTETDTRSQSISTNTSDDTEPTISIEAPALSKPVSTETKAQSSTYSKLDLPLSFCLRVGQVGGLLLKSSLGLLYSQKGSGQVRGEVIAPRKEPEHDS